MGALDEPIVVVVVILVTVLVVAEIWARARPLRRDLDDPDADPRRSDDLW